MSAATNDSQGANTLDAARALREALRLVTAGYQLVPVTITRRSDGKKGAKFHENWRHDRAWSTDPERIRDWSVQYACSFAVRTGPAGGVDVIDLDGDEGVNWWAERSHPLSSMLVDTISGGMHLYVPACGLPTVSKQFAPSVDTRGDGGLVFAPGSFVVGEEGTYRVRGEIVNVASLSALPIDLVAAIRSAHPDKAEHAADGRVTVHDREWMIQKTKAAVDKVAALPVHTDGSLFRDAQMGAAMMLGRLADVGLCTLDGARETIEEATLKVWPDGLSEADEKNIDSGLADGPRKERWQLRDVPLGSAPGSSPDDGDPVETAIAAEMQRLFIADEARRRFARARRAERPAISDGVIDDLDSIPTPEMLLGSLIPDAAIGFLAGRSGAYKSFLATAWACCIATGRSWLGKDEFAVTRALKTLYVAAEGAAGAAGRIRAWEARTGISRRGKLLLYPRPIHLNDAAQVDELAEYVVSNGIKFLVVDTYHRSAPGVEENSATDFGVVFEAAARLRDEHECAVLFVDHTGNGKAGNPRGSSAKRDDADYVLSAGYLGEEATSDAQRELFVTKLKDTDTAGRWPIRLAKVEDSDFPVIEIGVVDQSSAPLGVVDDGEWWRMDTAPEVPSEIVQKIKLEAANDRNRGVEPALWVWRYLAYVNDEQGLTRARIEHALAVIPRAKPFTRAAIDKAIPLLDKVGLVGRDRTRVWLE